MASDARTPVTRGFTPRGLALLAVGLAAAGGAFALQERELLIVAGICLSLPLLCALAVSARRTRLGGDLQAHPHALDVGGQGELVLSLTSFGRLPTPPAVVLPASDDGPADPIDIAPDPRPIAPLRAASPRAIAVAFRARRRGRALVPSPLVRFADPFGLWCEYRAPAAATSVLVLPPYVALEGLPVGLGRDRPGRSAGLAGEPDVVVRPYVPGDDVRTIHWRASARIDGDPVVRLREAGAARSVALVLDDRADSYGGSGLETAVSFAASVGMRVRRAGLPLSVSDAGGEVLVDGEEDPERLLQALALVGQADPASSRTVGRRTERAFRPRVPGRPELVVAFLGPRLESGEVAWLQRLAPGVAGLAFCVGGVPERLPAGWRGIAVGARDDHDDDDPTRVDPERLRGAVLAAWQASAQSGAGGR